MKVIVKITALILICFTSLTSAQVKFEAKVSKKKLGVNERLRIDFEMNQDGDNFIPPNFDNFTIVGGPNTSVSNSWIQGKRTFKKTYSYFLAPKRKGTFKIKQAVIEIQGQTYKTFPVTVKVTKAVDRPNAPPSASDVASDKIHLIAEVSKKNPYLNEAITVTYKLFFAYDIGLGGFTEKESPRFNDFWSQNIDIKGIDVKKQEFKGEQYRYITIKKSVLYPQKSGKLKLEPLVLDVSVEVPSGRADIFGRRLMTTIPQTVTAGSRVINVKALPEAGKPADFKGAVGDFSFNLTTSKTALKATESLQAKVEISGKGNLKLFELPELTTPSSLEVYEPEHKEVVSTNSSGIYGKVSDVYTIVPQFKGKYPIPEVTFSYFDLKSERYKTITSKDIIIDVTEGPNANEEDTNKKVIKQTVNTKSNAFAFIKTEPKWLLKTDTKFFKSTLFWILIIIPVLIIPIAILVRKKQAQLNSDIERTYVKKTNKLAKKYLANAKKNLNDKTAFYEALERALHNYLKSKLRIETIEFNKDKINELLTSKKANTETITDFIMLLENCELARYTPITQVAMQNDYDKAAKTIALIDKELR